MAKQVIPKGVTMGRTTLVVGNWGHVKPGCSVASGGKGDWAAHFNLGAGSVSDKIHGWTFSSVCKNTGSYKKAEKYANSNL
jgi:hypothetical protein